MAEPPRAALDRLFRPKTVAIIGASADPSKTAGRPLHFLRRHGFAGNAWPVNPRYDEIAGERCYPDLAALPGPPDAAIVLVGPNRAEAYVRDLAAMGAGAAIVLAGGYAETGEAGAHRQESLRAAAGSMRLLGPNTIGILNIIDGITLSASGALDVEDRPAGHIAVVSQSGGILGSILSRASARGIGLSQLVATGNEADLDVCDMVEYLLDDDATSVIALYLEGLRRAGRFRDIAQKAAARGKRLVVYKVGRSAQGARSAASHTGALAGEDRLYDALFDKTGVIRVDRYADLIDVPMALSAGPIASGNRIAVLTATGGAGALVADVAGMAGLDTPLPGPATAARLATVFSHDGFVADRNPIDLTLAGNSPEVIEGTLSALIDSPDYDAVIAIAGSSAVGQPDLLAVPTIAAAARATKPIVVYTSPSAPEIIRRLNRAGVPAFDSPESCAAALEALARRIRPEDPTQPVAASVPARFEARSGALNEAESHEIFAAFGIPPVREVIARDPVEAARLAPSIGSEVVTKILARGVAHKTELGGVRVGVPVAEVEKACREMAAEVDGRLPGAFEGFLAQERVIGGTEMILGFVRDPQLGPAILLGGGGIAAEAFDDTAISLCPLTPGDVAGMLEALKTARLLRGFRGRPAGDVAALIEAVLGFDRMCRAFGDRLVEAEINPLFVLAEGSGVKAADGLVVLR